MQYLKVKYNGLHDTLLRVPGHYGKTKKDDIIKVTKEIFEKELKQRINRNGQPEFILVEEKKQKAEKKETE